MRAALHALVVLACVAVVPQDGAAQSTRGWSATSDPAVRVFNLAGRTRVIGWAHDSVSVTGTVGAGGRLYGGGTRSALKMGVEPAVPGGEAPPAELEVRVPHGAVVSIKSAAADVDVRDLRNVVEVFAVSGSITVTGPARQVTAESMTGAVTVRGATNIVRVRTAGGTATVESAAQDLRIETVSGPIVVRGARARQARLESVTGRVTFDGTLARDGVLDVQTHESPVTLTVPATLGAAFELTTFDGLLVNRFADAAARPSRGGKPLKFTINGGGAQVTVRTLKGNVAVYRR